MSSHINASVSEEILKTARMTVAARLHPKVRHSFIDGKHDHFAAVQAVCDAIIVERYRAFDLLNAELDFYQGAKGSLDGIPFETVAHVLSVMIARAFPKGAAV